MKIISHDGIKSQVSEEPAKIRTVGGAIISTVRKEPAPKTVVAEPEVKVVVSSFAHRKENPHWILRALSTAAVTILLIVGFQDVKKFGDEIRIERILKMVHGGVPSDIIFDRVALNGDVSLEPFIKPKRKMRTQVENIVSIVPTRKRTPQQMVSEVYRIISDTNKRQRDARRLAMSIVAEASRQQFDPLFAAAVIKSESAFNEMAVSHKGAQGLMQIMPATGKYLANKHNMGETVGGRLKDSGINLRLGIAYLKQLEQSYSGNRLLTLVAYNWGPGKLDRAIKSGRGVPAECLRYALKILRDHHLWQGDVIAS